MAVVFVKDYEVLCQLAEGGMARLSLARKSGIGRFERLFAIKQILPMFAAQADFVRMFLDEARLVASLQHPNTVSVYEVDSAGGQVFLVMEFLHGHDLRSVLHATAGAPIPLAQAVSIAIGVSAGLHYAHERRGPDGKPLRIVHRDVSPHNVFVTFDGVPKVIDFGIAKAADRLNKTIATSIKGKVGYLSPEQARGEALDARSDVFSIGILLHEMLTGRKLFRGKNEYELLKSVIEDALPTPSSHNPSVPSELDRVVMRCLARDVDQRYASALLLERDLEEVGRTQGYDLSSTALRAFMSTLFADEVTAFRDAQRRGLGLAEHFMEIGRSQPNDGSSVAPIPFDSIAAPPSEGTATATQQGPGRSRSERSLPRRPRRSLGVALGVSVLVSGAAGIALVRRATSRATVTAVVVPAPMAVPIPSATAPSAPVPIPSQPAPAQQASRRTTSHEEPTGRKRSLRSRSKASPPRGFDPDAPLPR